LDSSSGVHPSVISARFHNGLINLCLACCQQIRSQTDARTAALSGGVWQNRILFNGVFSSLVSHGFSVLTHRQLPPNDGCISLGQVFVAAYQAQI